MHLINKHNHQELMLDPYLYQVSQKQQLFLVYFQAIQEQANT